MEKIEETALVDYWNFVEGFRGKKGLGMGDIRAYISAQVDLEILEYEVKKRNEIVEILEKVLKNSPKNDLINNYKDTLKKWENADKELLTFYSSKIKGNGFKIGEKLAKNDYKSISLFSGSYGLDMGFKYAGFESRVALDIDKASKEIINANLPNLPFIHEDIKNVTVKEILDTAGLDKGETDVLTGGPPCQPFSTAGKRKGLNDPRASPLREYVRVIKEAQPKIFVMEEVTGLLNARLKHVSIKDRGDRCLLPEEESGSVWKIILEELKSTGYKIQFEVVNAADYGTPQKRQRVILIGIRPDIKAKAPFIPTPTHKKPNLSSLVKATPWIPLLDSIMGTEIGELQPLSPKYQKYMPYVPPGGNWRQLPEELQEEAMNKAYHAGGGKMGFYRRLSWFEPSPTLVTSPTMKSTMMIHPWENRPLSVNEYKLIQGFPLDWKVPGAISTQYRKLGEAVPPTLSYAIAKKVMKLLEYA